ncbi:MAG: VOC family protein [Spirosomataceae bacterium]
MKTQLNPYLFFGGNCREAMAFYRSIFGGELTLTTFGEGPADVHSDPIANSEEAKLKIMHARLNGPLVILASDDPQLTGSETAGHFSLSIEGGNEEELTAYFEKLAENGRVTAPLIKQFWGEVFGMVTDKFGINWMVSISAA